MPKDVRSDQARRSIFRRRKLRGQDTFTQPRTADPSGLWGFHWLISWPDGTGYLNGWTFGPEDGSSSLTCDDDLCHDWRVTRLIWWDRWSGAPRFWKEIDRLFPVANTVGIRVIKSIPLPPGGIHGLVGLVFTQVPVVFRFRLLVPLSSLFRSLFFRCKETCDRGSSTSTAAEESQASEQHKYRITSSHGDLP